MFLLKLHTWISSSILITSEIQVRYNTKWVSFKKFGMNFENIKYDRFHNNISTILELITVIFFNANELSWTLRK